VITPAKGAVIAGKYVLERRLASGGMGSVWVARHALLEHAMAMKFMDPSYVASAEARTRFEREARVAAHLNSQFVAQVQDYGVERGTPYIVMELLEGESLSERLKRMGRIPLAEVVPIVRQIGKALRTAHEAGLVHRDLKPSNIFIACKDHEEVVKVLDFGIAKAAPSDGEITALTHSGVIFGTVNYMSPQQIRNPRTVDHRSDLWSLAVVLYRALSGRLPFPGQDAGDIAVRICTDPIPPPSSIAPDLRPDADAFFARALDREPDRRFQSADELSEAFCALVSGGRPALGPGGGWNKTLRMDKTPLPVAIAPPPEPPVESPTKPDRPNLLSMAATPPSEPSIETVRSNITTRKMPSVPEILPGPPPSSGEGALEATGATHASVALEHKAEQPARARSRARVLIGTAALTAACAALFLYARQHTVGTGSLPDRGHGDSAPEATTSSAAVPVPSLATTSSSPEKTPDLVVQAPAEQDPPAPSADVPREPDTVQRAARPPQPVSTGGSKRKGKALVMP
jgi:serine/threonine-protein kinase